MSNPENPDFDDSMKPEDEQIQNPGESDLDFMAFFDNDDAPVDLDLPEESELGENTSPFADNLNLFDDFGTSEVEELIVPDVPDAVMPEETEAFEAADEDTNADFSDFADFASEEVADSSFADTAIGETAMEGVVENDDVAENMIENDPFAEADDANALEAPVIAEESENKKGKKEKTPKVKKEKPPKKEKTPKAKKEKAPKVKKEKKPKEPGEKKPQNVAALCFAACLGIMILMFAGVNAYAFLKHGMSALVFLAIFDLFAAGALVIPILLRRAKDKITPVDVTAGIAAVSLIFACMFLLANLAYNLG